MSRTLLQMARPVEAQLVKLETDVSEHRCNLAHALNRACQLGIALQARATRKFVASRFRSIELHLDSAATPPHVRK